MEEKKYIDRLYQEKFKDFEAAPRKDLWEQISTKLQEERYQKPLFHSFWTRIAGIAAVFSLFFFLGEWLTQPRPIAVSTNGSELINKPKSENTSLSATTEPDKESPTAETQKNKVLKALSSSSVRKDLPKNISSITPTGVRGNSSFAEAMVKSFINENNGPSSLSSILTFEEVSAEHFAEEKTAPKPEGLKIVISTHAGPIYYGNLKSGNFLDPKFNNNSTESEITYSYGFNVAYAISEKLKIRSGISKVSMSHNTNDIALQAGGSPMAINNIRYIEKPHSISQGVSFKKEAPGSPATYSKSKLGSSTKGLLNQRIGFIEVPVELEYSLLEKKISINIIGGASTLFLDENMISVSQGNSSTVIGEASNLNDVSFSTNIGVGFDYDISENFKLNLEPMFKYQLNTFDAASGTYQPFYLGVYTGFSYKF